MRLFDLFEAGGPSWDYSGEEFRHGDRCPKCGLELRNKYTKMGKPAFVGCKNRHAFKRAVGSSQGEYQKLDPEKFWADYRAEVERAKERGQPINTTAQHTCGIESARGAPLSGSSLERWYRQHTDCEACNDAYDTLLDQELGDMPYSPDDLEAVADKSLTFDQALERLLGQVDPRASHSRGEFGSGHPAAIKPGDSRAVKAIKAIRDLGFRRGESGEVVIDRFKDRCGWEHTCREHPSGKPAWNFPMPDPVLRGGKKVTQGFNMFREVPSSTLVWPRSGAMGFEPKSEFETYVFSKLRCPVCNGSKKGCENPVSHEYGKPKPFCTEHMLSAPYAQELFNKYGGPGLPDQPDPRSDYWESERGFRKTQAGLIERGDRVRRGEDTGQVLEVDPGMEDRTHRVKWDNPRTKALAITWVDPEDLDLVK